VKTISDLARSVGIGRTAASRALSAGRATSWALGQRIAAQLDAAEVEAWLWRLRAAQGAPPSLAQLGGLLRLLTAEEATALIPILRRLLQGLQGPSEASQTLTPTLGAPGPLERF
jgi:hypothetical protein